MSINPDALRADFSSLLDQLLAYLDIEAKSRGKMLQRLQGVKLEGYIAEVLSELAKGSPFENSIELISGQRFPDIIAKGYYGIEVKTTKSNHWRSLGSSVAEGTRIAGIERIFMLFGKLGDPIQFRCKPYENCLSEVVVTHSPRYLIDMDLSEGQTFFDKLQIPYDELRRREDPLLPVIEYFKRNLKPGETTWWLNSSSESKATKSIIRLWSSLTPDEGVSLLIKGFCLFPELLSKRQDKFHRMLLWLSTEEGVLVGNLRDRYTAGGRVYYSYKGKEYLLPRIVYRVIEHLDAIILMLQNINDEVLSEYWNKSLEPDLYVQWCHLVSPQACEISEFPLYEYLIDYPQNARREHSRE